MDGNGSSNISRVKERPYFYDVALCDKLTKEIFYDKLGYKMISLPLFNKQPEELKTVMDQWLYLLKHLSTMDRLPSFLDKRIFGLIFEIGEIGKLTEEELMSYEASLKHKRDAESVFNSAKKSGEALGHAKGLAEGERKKALETAKAFKEMGLPIADIAKGTGFSVEEVEKL